jgi:hypothetical protein
MLREWSFDADANGPIMVLWCALKGKVAEVRPCGNLFRGTTWTRQGTSSSTWDSPQGAQEWCEYETKGLLT